MAANEPSREELEKALEKAKRDAQELWEKLTPEERERAAAATRSRIAEDQASMQKLLEDARAVAAGAAPQERRAPKFCTNCGAPVSGGKFCRNCGSPLGQ